MWRGRHCPSEQLNQWGSSGHSKTNVSIIVTSYWARWLFQSPASWLFTQPFIQAQITSQKTSKLRVTGLCEGNSPVTSDPPPPPPAWTSNAEDVSYWWRHHVKTFHEFPLWNKDLYHISNYANLSYSVEGDCDDNINVYVSDDDAIRQNNNCKHLTLWMVSASTTW